MIAELPMRHEAGISSLAVSPNGNVLCATANDDTASLWDLNTHEKIGVLAHKDSVNCCAFLDNDTVLTGSEDKTVAVWKSDNLERPVFVLRGFKEGINKIVFSHDRQTMFTACDDGQVYVHSTESGMPLLDRMFVSSNTVNDILIDEASGLMITCAEDCAVRVLRLGEWSNSKGDEDRVVNMVDVFESPVNHIALMNGVLYAASSAVVFDFGFDAATAQFADEANAFQAHEDHVRSIDFVSDSEFMTVSDDSTCILWNAQTHEPIQRIKVHDDIVMASAVRRNDSGEALQYITGCEDGSIRIWGLPIGNK